MALQHKMKETPDKHKVIFRYQGDDGLTTLVEAPLPDQFGMSVGSEFTAPFDANMLAGVLQKLKIPAASGISRKVGVVTTKFYANPEPTEISFDLEFHAEYSARDEVVTPIVALMAMSLGRTIDREWAESTIESVRGNIDNLLPFISLDGDEESEDSGTFDNWSEDTDNILSLIGIIRGPETVDIQFGNVYVLDNCWVSSVTPQFSNVVDAEGLPLSATCSVTCVIQRDPVVEDLYRFFGVSRGNS